MARRGANPVPDKIIGRSRHRTVLILLLVLSAAALLLASVTAPTITPLANVAVDNATLGEQILEPPRQPDAEQPPALRPAQIVVLVDESGSLSTDDIARERDAARLIAQGELAAASTVTVVGFASSDGVGQSPVDLVCPPTMLNSAENRQFLADCIGELREREENEGNGTDHVAALRQALSYLKNSATDQPKIVFLLTDGKLDVSNSSTYGKNLSPGERTEAARQQIPDVLDDLSRAGVQVWPLGYGDVDTAQLDSFAAGAAQESCGVQTPTPQATVIGGSADLLRAVRDAYATANCIGTGDIDNGALPSGGSTELSVDIPAIATDGAILVFKRDPRVTVSYLDPQGSEVFSQGGNVGISKFELSGQNTEVESLRIVDPMPGRWTVVLSSAASVPQQDVAATVIFQGAIRAVLTVSPPEPAAGQVVDVELQVRARQKPITDPELLQGLAFVATLTGSGFPPARIELTDEDSDAVYSGQLTIPPNAAGALTFTGSVTGLGVSGDERIFNTRVAATPPQVYGQLRLLFDDSEAHPGESVPGKVVMTNDSGRPAKLQLRVVDAAPGTLVTLQPAVLDLVAAGRSELDFGLIFQTDTAIGPNQATLQLIDETGTVVAQQQFASTVVPEPSLWQRLLWLWLLLGITALAALALLIARIREQRHAREVRHVRVELYRGAELLCQLDAPDDSPRAFDFVLVDDSFRGPRLESPQPDDDGAFRVERSRRGGFRLTMQSGESSELRPGERRDIGAGLDIVVLNTSSAGLAEQPEEIVSMTNSDVPPWY